jgi:hypothetical protein
MAAWLAAVALAPAVWAAGTEDLPGGAALYYGFNPDIDYSTFEKVDVKQLAKNPGGFLDKQLLLIGTVHALESVKGMAQYFVLRDPNGDTIRVRTNQGLPMTGTTWWVYGTGTKDPHADESLFISENARVLIPADALNRQGTKYPEGIPAPHEAEGWKAFVEGSPIVKPPREETTTVVVQPPSGKTTVVGLPLGGESQIPTLQERLQQAAFYVGSGLVALIVLLIVIRLLWPRSTPQSPPPPPPPPPPPADTNQIVVDHTKQMLTVKITPGTVKFLPGHLEVTAGAAVGERIPLCTQRTLIGRKTGDAAKGGGVIELADATCGISSKQAEIYYDGRAFWLLNLADPVQKNATVVDGRPLGVGEQVGLQENTEIKCCMYTFRFHPQQAYLAS